MSGPRTALVSGGSRGLGAALVEALLADGWRVATFSRGESPAIERWQQERGNNFYWRALDLADFDGLRDFVGEVRQRWGRIDALVNNAAIAAEGLLTLQAADDLHRTVVVNLESVLHLTRACAQVMLDQGSGSIVNVSSVNAVRGHSGVATYSATKAALDGLSRSLARELGPGAIRVNSVAPGYFASELTIGLHEDRRRQIIRRTPLGRLAEVGDIVGVVLFLLSPQAAFVTGQTIVVDGGLTC